MTPNPALGAHVAFRWADVLRRETAPAPHVPGTPYRRHRRFWTSGGPDASPAMCEGVVVGVRTLSDGTVDYGYSDELTQWYPETYFTAYLVAFDLRRKPVLVKRLEPVS